MRIGFENFSGSANFGCLANIGYFASFWRFASFGRFANFGRSAMPKRRPLHLLLLITVAAGESGDARVSNQRFDSNLGCLTAVEQPGADSSEFDDSAEYFASHGVDANFDVVVDAVAESDAVVEVDGVALEFADSAMPTHKFATSSCCSASFVANCFDAKCLVANCSASPAELAFAVWFAALSFAVAAALKCAVAVNFDCQWFGKLGKCGRC